MYLTKIEMKLSDAAVRAALKDAQKMHRLVSGFFQMQRKDAESILVRVPLIPDYNTVEDQNKSAEKLREMGVERLDLFEYRVKK